MSLLFEIDTEEPEAFARIRRSESIGRPLGDTAFLYRLATVVGRDLKPGTRGRKAKAD